MDAVTQVSFKLDADLQKDPQTSISSCLTDFLSRRGTIVGYSEDDIDVERRFKILPGDAVYPICSGGVCRSQTLWAKLYPFRDKIVLFPPHAARHGWDPYNGKVNRGRNVGQEDIPDDFAKYFKMERAQRFGFEHAGEWSLSGDTGQLDDISKYYSTHYFGPESTFRGVRGTRRVYVAFSNNIHVVMHRLNQSNDSLANVFLVAIDWEDMVSHPPEELNIVPRSVAAYAHFDRLLSGVLDLSMLEVSSSLVRSLDR